MLGWGRVIGWWLRDWCCPLFREAFEARAGRGQFVFASPTDSLERPSYSFWLAFRSVVEGDIVHLLDESAIPPDVKLTLSSLQAILYCPWCGRRLAKFYGSSAARLVESALCEEFQVTGRDWASI